jgi:hypothetical protein
MSKTISGVAFAAALTGFVLFAASDPITILVRDARTHYAVRANIKLQGRESVSLQTDATGRLNHMVSAGKYGVWYGVEVSAPGYRIATNRFLPGLSRPLTIMLVPDKAPEEEQSEAVALRVRPGYTLLHGYAVDVNTGEPVSSVRVRVAKAETLTDARGHYWLSVPTPGSSQPELPGTDAVIAEKNGYETIILNKFSITAEDMQGPMFDVKKGRPWVILGQTLESARASLQAGADPNLKDDRGWTALTLACNMGTTGLVKALIEAGADVNLEGGGGGSPLMEASFFNHADIVELLIQAGATVNKEGKDGTTAFMLARWMCHSRVVEALARAVAVIGSGEWRRAPQFEDFPISAIRKEVPAPVDLRSHREASVYRTRLREGARKGPNFAGHYTVVSWGCGSNCESSMIVDTLTGRVYDGFGDERGAEFKINSNQ